MKRYSTYLTCLWLTIGAALLSACSHDQWEPETVPGEAASTMQDSCYINLRIVNGQQSLTRATEAEENAIYDGILAIFEGADAANATLKTAVVIDQLINNPHETIPRASGTEAINITQRLAAGTHQYNSKLYVLALLNTTSAGFRVSGTTLQFNKTTIPDANSDTKITLADIQALTPLSVGSPDEHVGLFMMNNTLVEATALFDTEVAARATGAARITITVERAAARISVTNNATTLSAINLNANSGSHPTIHHISWALATEATTGFSLYQQQSHQSGDAIYVPASATSTNVIVEVQLKDGSFLMDDCYAFFPDATYSEGTHHDLFTSASQYIAHLKGRWESQKGTYNLGSRSADEIYGNIKIELADNGNVTITFTMDTSDYTTAETTGLNSLKTFLQAHTKGFRNGKMYYTYNIGTLARNNAYNLSLQDGSISGIGRATP